MTSPNHALDRAVIGKPQQWQNDAWMFYDTVGELRFGIGWIANGMSRVNLITAMPPLGPGDEPTPIDLDDPRTTSTQRRAIELVAMIADGPAGQGQLLGAFGTHLSVAGIAWLVIEPATDDPEDDVLRNWDVYATDELRQVTEGIEVRTSEKSWRLLHPNAIVVRVWRRHPRESWRPDAPTRSVLTVLNEIDLLTKHIQASAQSRLAGAGILAIPSEATFPPGQGAQSTTGADPQNENLTAPEDTFVETLIDAMTVPLADRSSAASVVPLVIKVPGELVDKISHISFSTPFDAQVLALLENAVKRLALGLDIPPEVLTGMTDANHWCLDIKTAAYDSERGWVSGDEVSVGDHILATDPAGRLVWSVVMDRYQATLNDEPMVRVHMHGARRGEMAIEMTPGHRNVIERDGQRMIVTADELQPGDLVPLAALGADWSEAVEHGAPEESEELTISAIERFHSSQTVWCPTTATGTWLAQDPTTGWAFVTGNSAWQIAEEAITLHLEPLSETITNALTLGYLRPALESEGYPADEIAQVMVWHDTSDLRTRPDLTRSAVEAYDRTQLSAEAMLREMGLSVADMPDEAEKRERVLLDAAARLPSFAPAILAELGYLQPQVIAAPIEAEPVEPTTPAEPEMPADGPPDREESTIVSAALASACDVIVRRALERAGNRLRSAAGRKVPGGAASIECDDITTLHTRFDATEHADLATLLDGAWTMVPEVAERLGCDAEPLIATLDAYTRALLSTGQEHRYGRLAVALGE